MVKAVIFDMYETLITYYGSPLYFGAQMAADAGIQRDTFYALWEPTEAARGMGMHAVQAVWYLKEGTQQPAGRKEGFRQLETPLEVLGVL